MQKCSQCNKLLKVGDEVHIVDEQIFCSDECAVVYLTNEIICSAKETAKETYNDNVTVLTIRPTKDSARCKICGQNLAEFETIFAAEGYLYCSRTCGIHDYTFQTNNSLVYAKELFDSVAEELNPKDIGLEV